MARRNHMYQRTMRLLVYKLREKSLANNADKSEEDLNWLICQSEQLKTDIDGEHQEVEKPKDYAGDRIETVESASTGEQIMKLLYACLEDLEMERLGMLPADNDMKSRNFDSVLNDGVLTLPTTSIDKLTTEQRHDFLRQLLRIGLSLVAVNENTTYPIGTNDRTNDRTIPRGNTLCCPYGKGSSCKAVVPVEDILALPMSKLNFDEPVTEVVGNQKPVSVGVQTDQGIGGD